MHYQIAAVKYEDDSEKYITACPEDEAEFYSVYRMGEEGTWECLMDFPTLRSAENAVCTSGNTVEYHPLLCNNRSTSVDICQHSCLNSAP